MDAKAKRVVKAAKQMGVPHDPNYGQGLRHDYWVRMLQHAQPIPTSGIGMQEVSAKISFLKELLPRIKNDQGQFVADHVGDAIQRYNLAFSDLRNKDQRSGDAQAAYARECLRKAIGQLANGRG